MIKVTRKDHKKKKRCGKGSKDTEIKFGQRAPERHHEGGSISHGLERNGAQKKQRKGNMNHNLKVLQRRSTVK